MNKAGQRIRITIATAGILHVTFLIIGLIAHNLPVLVCILNSLIGLTIIAYWASAEMRITQRIWLAQEIAGLFSEVLIAGSAIYCILDHRNSTLVVAQYVVFGLHFTGLLVILALLRNFGWKVG